MITTHPQDQFIYNKQDAVFECIADGSESLKISWTKNNEHISNSNSKISFITINNGKKSVLKVKKATVDDSGVYHCIATNADNETVLSKAAELSSKIVTLN